MVDLRENWRVILLTVVLLTSAFALVPPSVYGGGNGDGNAAADGPTNLRYGLQLAGGTRVRAPLVGVTAESVAIRNESTATVGRTVAAELSGIGVTDVIVRQRGQRNATVEVTANVTTEQVGAGIEAAGYEHGRVREGLTEPTRQQALRVLRSKVNEAGLTGGTVQVTRDAVTGNYFFLIEVPDADRERVIDLIESRGEVTVQAYHSTTVNGSQVYQSRTVLTGDDFQTIGTVRTQNGAPRVPVTVKGNVADRVQTDMVETGVAGRGGSDCTYSANPNTTQPCLLVVVDGRVVNSFGMEASLASQMRSGTWAADPRFVLTATNVSDARSVAINLRAGALPSRLDLDSGTTSFVSASQGADFKINSLLTGIVAILAVSGTVFLRYGEPKVALPMVVTALSEVFVLLGFAAAVGYALDLSVIAGLIAVIGTGVDDLIIIADEVMSEGDVNSRRVFRSRFRKAFWVIGAAAATTIIAMSPLAVLSLGDLRGFAIFTILGVVVGVLLTRPAYGDILRALLTDQ